MQSVYHFTGCVCLSFTDSALPRLADAKAVEAFIDSAEVVVIAFLEVRQRKLGHTT